MKDLIKSVILADCPVKPILPQKNESSEDFSKRLDGMMNDLFRNTYGDLNEKDGIDCPKCHNVGLIYWRNEEGFLQSAECSCMKKRNALKSLKNSGLGGLVENCTFENFIVSEPFQERIKKSAFAYSHGNFSNWLWVSGQSGCGKTHICTAVCIELINRGNSLKYMTWTEINQKLDAFKYRAEEYEQFVSDLKKPDILYIDDFLKTPADPKTLIPDRPPQPELRNAYTVINARDFVKKRLSFRQNFFYMNFLYSI